MIPFRATATVGEIVGELAVSGEPQRFFQIARAQLQNVACQSVSVSFPRPNRPYWQQIGFAPVTATARKQADDQLSALCDRLKPREIEIAAEIHDAAFRWLSGRTQPPQFDGSHLGALVFGTFVGKAEAIFTALDSMHSLDSIRRLSIGTTYLSGKPPEPYTRMLPAMDCLASVEPAIAELSTWSAHLSDGARDALIQAIGSARAMFERRRMLRETKLREASHIAFGKERGEAWLNRTARFHGSPIGTIEGGAYEDNLAYLATVSRKRPAATKGPSDSRIRSWRAGG